MAKRVKVGTKSQAIILGIRAVRDYHSLGRQHKDNPGSKNKLAQKIGMERMKFRKAIRVATEYSEEDLRAFFSTCHAHGFAPTVGHIVRLAEVPRAQRKLVQDDAIKGHWTASQLRRRVKIYVVTNPHVGRKPAPIESIDDVYVGLHDMGVKWERWFRQLEQPSGNGVTLSRLPKEIQQNLRQASRTLAKLKAAADKHLKRRRPLLGR